MRQIYRVLARKGMIFFALGLLIAFLVAPLKTSAAPLLTYDLLGTHPDAAAQDNDYGENLNSLEVLNNKIYAGYGNASANTGPVQMNPYDIDAGEFTGSELEVPTEEAGSMRIIGGQLHVAMFDPTCGFQCPAGYAVGEPWSLKTPVQAIHVFDTASLNGTDRWMVGSSEDPTYSAYVWRSENGVNNWQIVQSDVSSPVGGGEIYRWIEVMDGKVYVQATNVNNGAPVRIFDGNQWTTGTTEEITGSRAKTVTFADNIVTTKDGLSKFDGTTLSEVSSFVGQAIDMYVADDYLYVLKASGLAARTQDLETWQELGPTVDDATSIAVHDGRIYVGTGESQLYGSNEEIPDESWTSDVPPEGTDFPPTFDDTFGSQGLALSNTADITKDTEGNSYLLDLSSTRKVYKFDSDNNFVTSWGSSGSGDGQFSSSSALYAHGNNIYLVDGGNDRVQKFDRDGNFISKWGTSGSGNGQLSSPTNMVINDDGDIFVTDSDNNRVQKFTSEGVYISQFGAEGSGDGEFFYPYGIALDSSENIYVVDAGNGRVQKFNSAGVYQSQFGALDEEGAGTGEGLFSAASQIAIDSTGNIYVSDPDYYRIQKFNSSGVFVTQWGEYGEEEGQFTNLRSMFLTSDNEIIVANGNTGLHFFDTDGAFIETWLPTGLNPGKFQTPEAIAINQDGDVYVVDKNNDRIQVFTAEGEFVRQFGVLGTADGQFDTPTGIAIDSANNVYVTDSLNDRIQKFTPEGIFITKWGSNGSGDGQFNNPKSIGIDANDSVYVVDPSNARIQKFTTTGSFVSEFGSSGNGNGEFSNPQDIAFDSSDNIYITDGANYRVQKFDSDFNYLDQWGQEGTGNGQFAYPVGIAVDAQDNVYVTEGSNNFTGDRIQKFSADGTYRTKWGSQGTATNQFRGPSDIAVAPNGALYTTEQTNNRVQIFSYHNSMSIESATGSDILIETPEGTSITCADTFSEQDMATDDDGLAYPIGLVDFCLSVVVGSTQEISITFETDLKAEDVTAKKYSQATQQYSELDNAVITETTLNGNPALVLVYDVTDGGEHDQDSEANGEILDPVGLAVAVNEAGSGTTEESDDLAATGDNLTWVKIAAFVLVGTGLTAAIYLTNHRKKELFRL